MDETLKEILHEIRTTDSMKYLKTWEATKLETFGCPKIDKIINSILDAIKKRKEELKSS